jgi:DNA-binding CsgD family transcriptional regulator
LRESAPVGIGGPPFPLIMPLAAWFVFRVDPEQLAALLPAGLSILMPTIGVLALYQAKASLPFAPFSRAFAGVAVTGYDSPDVKEAVYVVSDVASPGADEVMRAHYSSICVPGEPRIRWDDGLLRGTVAIGGKVCLSIACRPTGALRTGVTGLDAYLGTTADGLTRHIISYGGGVMPSEVVSFEVSDDAPPALRAMQPTEMLLGTIIEDLHVTLSEPTLVRAGRAPDTARAAVPEPALVDLLRPMGLTPAEAKLAALIGTGCTARSAAEKLQISQHTARSTLKQVYAKLGIRKQTELAHLIARVQLR